MTLDHIITEIALPVLLISIMFTMGLSLTFGDFRAIAGNWRTVLAGLVSLLLFVPSVGYVIAANVDAPAALKFGLFLIATLPSGTFSNILSYYGRGDLALSISITAVASCAYTLTAPLWVAAGLGLFMGGARIIDLPALRTFEDLGTIIVVPTLAGMAARRWMYRGCFRKVEQPLRGTAAILVLGIFVYLLTKQQGLSQSTKAVAPAVVLLNVLSVGIGWFAARLARAPHRQLVSVVCEHAIRQEAIGIYVVVGLLGVPAAALPLMLNSFVGPCVGACVIGLTRVVAGRSPSCRFQ